MIDKPTFVAEMTILRDRFGRRDMTPETVARYLDYLDAKLTTAQFKEAAREIFDRDTWWPAPHRFIEALQGGAAKELAETAWTEMLEHARKGHYPDKASLAPAVLAALTAAPLREIMGAESDIKLARLKREFCAAHERATETTTTPHAAQLPSAPAELTP